MQGSALRQPACVLRNSGSWLLPGRTTVGPRFCLPRWLAMLHGLAKKNSHSGEVLNHVRAHLSVQTE